MVAGLNPDGLGEAARAIMTTDTRPKASLVKGIIDGKEFTLAGIAKGSGMIHPDMATLLVFLFTDAAASPKVLKTLLRQALPKSFNRITVDGDTSTNDTILLLAGGRAGNAVINEAGAAMSALGEAVNRVMGDLARQVVADGEGARHVYRVEVMGAATAAEAKKAALTVALSPLVKTAMAGEDVNWGRIMAALGRAGARFDPERVEIAFGGPPRGAKRPGAGSQGRSRGPAGDQVRRLYGDHPPEPRGLCRLLRHLRPHRGLHPHQRRLPELMIGSAGPRKLTFFYSICQKFKPIADV